MATRTSWADGEYERALLHLKELGRRLKIEIRWVRDPKHWGAIPPQRMAWLPKPLTPFLYLVGLHELGHVGSSSARQLYTRRFKSPEAQIREEGAAWAWAATNADPSLTARTDALDWAEVTEYFGTYLRWAASGASPD